MYCGYSTFPDEEADGAVDCFGDFDTAAAVWEVVFGSSDCGHAETQRRSVGETG